MIHKCLHSFKRSIKRELRFGGEEVYKKIRKENFPNSKKGSRLLRACQVSSKVKFQSQEEAAEYLKDKKFNINFGSDKRTITFIENEDLKEIEKATDKNSKFKEIVEKKLSDAIGEGKAITFKNLCLR